MILYVICLIMIIAAPLAYIILGVTIIGKRIKLSIAAATLLCLLAGIILPVLAMYMDMANLPDNVRCATPSLSLAFLGIMITMITIPIAAVIFFTIHYYRNKKERAA